MTKRIASLWFPHMSIERVMRRRLIATPFAMTIRQHNTETLYALSKAAELQGLSQGMGVSDARALCPQLTTEPANIPAEVRFLESLSRWARRYCPRVGIDGQDGLLMDITGSTHLWGGEESFLRDIQKRFARTGLAVSIGIADTRGAAWALAHFDPSIAKTGQSIEAIQVLPLAALRLENATLTSLARLGLRKISDLHNIPRSQLTRRFGRDLLMRWDQALGEHGESIIPIAEPDYFATRMNIPDPIGLVDDVMAALARILEPLCEKLGRHNQGVQAVLITLRRVDNSHENLSLRFARPMRSATEILPLLTRHIEKLDAGFGIDQMRIEAQELSLMTPEQITSGTGHIDHGFDDLMTRIGNRVGFGRITRFHPIESHLPDRSFEMRSIREQVGKDQVERKFSPAQNRPLTIFQPEAIAACGTEPPKTFRWRRMLFKTAQASGPERISPEWWREDENWRSGVRDYWRVATVEGRRLWLFYTPQHPNWYVHGEFL